jgi:hypothetical protein
MLKTFCGIGLAALLLAAECPAAAPDCRLVPGWSQKGAARTYAADNLFEYMDGNAEGYLIYGFHKMQGVSCVKGDVTFVIDVSDMGDADSAYGIFTANRDPRRPAEQIGMGGQVLPRRAIFAKGSHYIEIAANPAGDHSAALKEWLLALEKVTEGSTSLPPAIGWFPAEKRQSIRLVPESVLGLRVLKRGYVAQYEFGKAFVLSEATPEAAAAVMKKLRDRFGETAEAKAGDDAFQFTDAYLGRLCFFRKGNFVGGYANVADGQDPVALAGALAANIR